MCGGKFNSEYLYIKIMENEMRKQINKVKNFLNKDMTSISPSPFGGTKNAEYRRSIQHFENIYKEKGLYFALAMLYDSQYDRNDILAMMEILKPGKGKISDILKKGG